MPPLFSDRRVIPVLKLNAVLQKIEVLIGAVLVAVILFVSALQIVFRYFLRSPLGWTNEVACYSLVWVTFLTLAHLYSKRRHVALTVVYNRLSKRGQAVVSIFFSIVLIVGFLVLLPSCIDNMNYMILSPALKIPQKYVYAVIPVSFILIVFHSVCLIIEDAAVLKGKGEKE